MRFWLEVALKRKKGLVGTERASGFVNTGGREVRKGDIVILRGLAWKVERTGNSMPEAEISRDKQLGRIGS